MVNNLWADVVNMRFDRGPGFYIFVYHSYRLLIFSASTAVRCKRGTAVRHVSATLPTLAFLADR